MNISLNDRRIEEVETCREGESQNNRSEECMDSIRRRMKKRLISQEAKIGMHEGIIEPSLLYGCEVWPLRCRKGKEWKQLR